MDYKKKHKSSRSHSRERDRHSRPKLKESKRSWQSRTISDTSSSDSSLYSKPVKRKRSKHSHESRHRTRHTSNDRSKDKKSHKRRHSSHSDSSSVERKKKKKKKKKKKHKKLKEEKNKSSEAVKLKECGDANSSEKIGKKETEAKESIGPTPKMMAPMTKEAWEKQQSVIRHVIDETTGRRRLVKGDGEILEEIVSKERHQEINKQATMGDALHYQVQMGLLK
ncbi:ADP-ribosylation factor-like protein 6-interacting protein 4 [Gigantopelta aegis]|uniref:ADP-ribosylation factor-like protein 6-interacting protein 4 n=1 Tax=Gigantopelta aegis TaxID=1735272 RepID=UPI001B88E419|nr:ADP-ribosylation factor-like protein 6-interacting protein 4 [Gigantopelta aegis]